MGEKHLCGRKTGEIGEGAAGGKLEEIDRKARENKRNQ